MKTKSTLVIDAKNQVIRCEVCKKEYPLSDFLPAKISEFIKRSKELTSLHARCKQAKEGRL